MPGHVKHQRPTHLNRFRTGHEHTQSRRRSQALLGGRDDNVEPPIIESDLLGCDSTDGVDGYQGLG